MRKKAKLEAGEKLCLMRPGLQSFGWLVRVARDLRTLAGQDDESARRLADAGG